MFKRLCASACMIFLALTGCGYTTGSLLPSQYRTIHIEPFKNSVVYTGEGVRENYIPLLETKVREAVNNRFLYDGHLRVAQSDKADMVLKGELLGFAREELRLSDNDDVQEYRIRITVSLTMTDQLEQTLLWTENSFAGEATYFISGPQAKPESAAIEEALVDLARRIVERTVESW